MIFLYVQLLYNRSLVFTKLPLGRRYRNANHESQQRRQVRQVRGPEAGGEVYSQGESKTNFLHTFSTTF